MDNNPKSDKIVQFLKKNKVLWIIPLVIALIIASYILLTETADNTSPFIYNNF